MSSIVNKIKDEVGDASIPSGQHLAAILRSKGSALEVNHRPTPTLGANDLLIEVKSIALNPVDWYQREYGFPPISYPVVISSYIAGTVVSAGSSVPFDAPKPGTRVSDKCPVSSPKAPQTTAPSRRGMSFNKASLLPMAVVTAWSGWYTIGVPRDTAHTAADKKGMMVRGGASNIGSAAVQVAKLMGFSVYATASEKHHEYLKGLGARKVFDYKGEYVVRSIVEAAKEDGVTVQMGFDAISQLKSCMEILKELKGEGPAKLASAIPLSEDSPKVEGVEVEFVAAPGDEKERMEFFHFVFGVWLKGEFVPSPKIQVVEGGLESVQKGLDKWKKRVSGVKLALEV